jgi:MscS family membrane protein
MDLFAILIGLMFLLHSLGINPSTTLAGLGVGGIAVALAAQKTLENVIGGASLIMDGVVGVGDSVKVGDVVGTIETIGLRSTRVRTLDRTIVSIPNGQMATMTLENYSARDQFWLRHLIGLGYETAQSDLNAILTEVRSILETDPRVLPGTPRVRLLRFGESSLELEVFGYISARDWSQFLEIQEDLLIRIRELVASFGAQIAFPTRTVYVKNEFESGEQSQEDSKSVARVAKEAAHELPLR